MMDPNKSIWAVVILAVLFWGFFIFVIIHSNLSNKNKEEEPNQKKGKEKQ